MKRIKFILFFCVLISISSINVFCQNLVPNPSFEIYSGCPDDQSQTWKAAGWGSFGGSPDYFNSCATNPDFGVPYNAATYQYAFDGSAYCGIYTYDSANYNLREFLGIQLSSSLIVGATYHVSIKVNATIDTLSGSNASTNYLGVKFFTSDNFDSVNAPTVNNLAHIYSSLVITDTTNWTSITGSFVADSAYNYLVIGNFFDDSQLTIIKNFNNSFYPIAYYFLDDIYVSTSPIGLEESIEWTNTILFPIPCSNELYFKSQTNLYRIEIFNYSGKFVKAFDFFSMTGSIQIGDLPSGCYFVKLLYSNDSILTKKIIIN